MNYLETERLSIKTGAPQGCVLGPFLFLININDLPDVSDKAGITMFANDTTLIQSGKGTKCLFPSEMKPVSDWLSNKLTIIPVKCEAMCFVCGKPENFKIWSAELDHNTSCKYLGVHLDTKMKLHEHIDYVVKKLNKLRGLTYRIRHFHPRKGDLIFYNSFAKTLICYGLLVYRSAAETNSQKNLKQNRKKVPKQFFSRQDWRHSGGYSSRS